MLQSRIPDGMAYGKACACRGTQAGRAVPWVCTPKLSSWCFLQQRAMCFHSQAAAPHLLHYSWACLASLTCYLLWYCWWLAYVSKAGTPVAFYDSHVLFAAAALSWSSGWVPLGMFSAQLFEEQL